MKRQISICIFFVSMLALSAFVLKPEAEKPIQEIPTEEESGRSHNQNETAIESNKEYSNCIFYIINKDGYVCVYENQTEELYLDTGIEVSSLPQDLQEKIHGKIYFKTHEELYDFLESYSS